MPKFKISATGAGGRPVGEIVVEKVGREQALDEGISELLLNESFPPEAVQLYREGIARGYERGDIFDTMIAKFNLQFWCDAVKDDQPIPPVAERVVQPPVQAPQPHAPVDGTIPRASQTPRQIIQAELKRHQGAMRAIKTELDQMKRRYEHVKGLRDECVRLLKNPPPPKVKSGKRNLQSV